MADGGQNLLKIAIKCQRPWPRFVDIINWNESYMYYDVDGTENRSLTSYTRIQFSPTNPLLSTYLTCHYSAIYTNKVTCLPCMLFTCLFLLLYANYALNYTNWRSPWDRWVYFRFRSRCVLADIGTLEMLVYNLKINRKLRKFKHVFHFGRYYQLSIELKRKLDGKSIANFVNKSTIFPHKIIVVHLPDLYFLCYIYL